VVLNDQCPFLNEITFKADSESLSQWKWRCKETADL
jgi:hypothetical protein